MKIKAGIPLLATAAATLVPLPALADDALFSASLIRCGVAFASDGCGFNVPTDPLDGGRLQVNPSGKVHVKLRGAMPNANYQIYVGVFTNDVPAFHFQYPATFVPIGFFSTNARGNFSGLLKTSSGTAFAFPVGTRITGIHFAVNNQAGNYTAFTTGMNVTNAEDD